MTSAINTPTIETAPKPMVLVADDLKSVRILATKALKTYFDVELAFDGRQAVDAWETASESTRPFCAILMDIEMPIIDEKDLPRIKNGIEATEAIRAIEDQRPSFTPSPVPIIAHTSLVKTGVYLTFPLSETQLQEAQLDETTLAKVQAMAAARFTAVLGKPTINFLALENAVRESIGIPLRQSDSMPASPMPASPMPASPMPYSPMPYSPMPYSPMPAIAKHAEPRFDTVSAPPNIYTIRLSHPLAMTAVNDLTTEEKRAKRRAFLETMKNGGPARLSPISESEEPTGAFHSLSLKEKGKTEKAE